MIEHVCLSKVTHFYIALDVPTRGARRQVLICIKS